MNLKKFWQKIEEFDWFNLGVSASIYFFLMYLSMPLLKFLGVPSRKIQWFVSEGVPLITGQALLYVSLGVAFFILGYLLFPKIFKVSQKNRFEKFLRKKWRIQNSFFLFFALLLIDLVNKAVSLSTGIYFHLNKNPRMASSSYYSLIGFLDWVGPIALAIAFLNYFELKKVGDHRYKLWQYISWLVFAFEFFYGFFSGSVTWTVIPIVVYLIVKHYAWKKSFVRLLLAGIFILFILFPAVNFYKNPNNFFTAYLSDHKVTPKVVCQFATDNSIGRIDQGKIISSVVEKNKHFLYGRTFLDYFIALGPPRFIWKNKPRIGVNGNIFGREYKILGKNNYNTSVAATNIGTWYMNFGLPGIIFGMFLFGFLFRFVYEIFIVKSSCSLSGILIYSIFWPQMIKGLENWIAPLYAGLTKIFIFLLFIIFLLILEVRPR